MARDKIHYVVKEALEKEGWKITHDPFPVKIGRKSTEIDLGAEKVIAAEKGSEKIAVEVKSFIATSTITAFYHALGQFLLYQRALKIQDPDRTLYLAIPFAAYEELSDDVFDYPGFEDLRTQLIILESENTIRWIK